MTPSQKTVLQFMQNFEEKERCPASTRKIAKGLGYKSQNSVMKHLRALAKQGLVEQLTDLSWVVKRNPPVGGVVEVGVFGSIAAGLPANAEQEAEEKIVVDPAVHGLAPKKHYWALRVRGDSMTDAHIVDGDIAILEKREARPGEIVAALIDDTTTTLKRYVVEHGRAILRAANPRYADLVPERLVCQGVLVSLIGRGVR